MRALRKLGHLDEAESELTEALRLYPGDPHSHFEMALVLEARETADVDFEPTREAREKLGDLER
ncbi:hypothetical protein [Candidatus Palauibacter sp.]|uniref:hypothetical protein n=1 Tax=Candidatus Palauibacter sp. TaxID=3101350 RepID=UPI003AF277FA